MYHLIEDLRIKESKVLLPPAFLEEEMPVTRNTASTVHQARTEIAAILRGEDRRLLVVVGPCSIHDPDAAREYATHLLSARGELEGDLCIVMRVYFEKPRTTVGWKGLINDPYLDESFKINDGLRLARRLLLDLGDMGMPVGTEFLDMIVPQYVGGLVSWGAIGARTTESQIHRQLISGISCPVGFKNGTSGDVQVAVEAVQSSARSHTFLGHTKFGQSAIFVTTGNPDCHIILRGGRSKPNYDAASVVEACAHLEKAALRPHLMIDCSHGNSGKNHTRQKSVCLDVIEQIKRGDRRIIGVMLESSLVAGAQELSSGKPLAYGQSITDACIGWDETWELLHALADAARFVAVTNSTGVLSLGRSERASG
jgi:3-deoxy-7-phosphoheptulonate synthase